MPVIGMDMGRPKADLTRELGSDLVPGEVDIETAVAIFSGGSGAGALTSPPEPMIIDLIPLVESLARERSLVP